MKRIAPCVALLLSVLCRHAAAAPVIQDISPPHAPFGVAQPVAITGAGFQPGARLTLHRGGPYLLGSVRMFHPEQVVVSGVYAYVAEAEGVKVVDVSSPASPRVVGFLKVPFASDIAIAGNRIYVTNYDKLIIADVSNPAAPRRLGSLDCGYAQTVAVAGKRAYVADQGRGLLIVDVSRPSAPRLLGRCRSVESTYGLAVVGNLVYAADDAGGLAIVDVSVPSAPEVIGRLEDMDGAWDVAVAGSYAYVATGQLEVIDISDPRTPVRAAAVSVPGGAFRLTMGGATVHVAAAEGGLQTVDVTNPSAPIIVGSASTPGFARGVAVSGTLAYVADIDTGLMVFDVSQPVTPPLAAAVATPGPAGGIAVAGDRAFVADGDLQVFDITNPLAVAHRKSLVTPGSAQSVTLSGSMALVGDGDAGVTIVDISNPDEPAILGTLDTPGTAQDIALAGNYAYVADGEGGLRVANLTNPAAPVDVAHSTGMGTVRAVSAGGGNLVLATYSASVDGQPEDGLFVIDVSVPSAPVVVSKLVIPASAVRSVTAEGTVAYVADSWNGLHVVDVSTPASPRIVVSFGPEMPWYANDISVVDGYAYLSTWQDGLVVVDVSRPAAPRLLESFMMSAQGVAVADGYAFVAAGGDGLRAVPLPEVPAAVVVDATRIEALLPAGRYPGRYHVRVVNADDTEIVLPNAFEVDGAALRVSATAFAFEAWRDYLNPPPATLGIVNTGNSVMTWTVGADAAWLTVAPDSGNSVGNIAISTDIAGLPPGLHAATITVSSLEAPDKAVAIPVTLRIMEPTAPLVVADFSSFLGFPFRGRWGVVDNWAKSLSTTGVNRLVLSELPAGGRIEVDLKLGRGGLAAPNASVVFGSFGERPRYVKLTAHSLTIGGRGEVPVVAAGTFRRGIVYHLTIDAYPDGRVSALLTEGGSPVAKASAVFAQPGEGMIELRVVQAISSFANLSVYHPSVLP